MMKAFYINLDRRPDRRRRFEAVCERAGLVAERIAGTDGRCVPLPEGRGEQERGYYGNLLSHLLVLERARALRLPEVMILEDDAEFPEWFLEEVDYFMSLVPDDWGLIYFGGHGFPRRWGHVRGPVLRCSNVLHTECYVVRCTAYDRVIGELTQAKPHSRVWTDTALLRLQEDIPTYTMLNPIVRQAIDFSDDVNRVVDDEHSRCDIPGWFTDAEGEEYLRQIRRFDRPIVAELGTYKGRSASFVAETIHRRGGTLFCIDTWDAEPAQWGDFEWWMNASGLRHCLNSIRMDTVKAASFFADRCFDLVFIDSDHSYEHVKRELGAWLPKLRRGGVAMGHDYVPASAQPRFPDWAGVRWALEETLGVPPRVVDTVWVHDV